MRATRMTNATNARKVDLYAVMTLDGKIALGPDDRIKWSSAEDKAFLSRELERFELVFVGRVTHAVSGSFLSGKTCVVFTRSVETLTHHAERIWYAPLDGFNVQRFMSEHGFERAALLGGAQIYSYFVQRGWVDQLYLTVEPLTFGRGTSLLSGCDARREYRLINAERLNSRGSLLLHYEQADQTPDIESHTEPDTEPDIEHLD